MDINKDWDSLKELIDNKSLNLQYNEPYQKDYYEVFAVEGPIVYHAIIDKSSIEASELEGSYLSNCNSAITEKAILSGVNKDMYGNYLFSPTFSDTPGEPKWQDKKWSAIAGSATSSAVSFHDIQITTEVRIRGGEWFVQNFENVHENDFIELSIVDKDDSLGLFSLYGYTVGIDIIELAKFIKTSYIFKQERIFKEEMLNSFPVVTGLYLRMAYTSYGNTNIKIITPLLWYEL